MKKKIEIYTDGSGNSLGQPGGWGFVIVLDGKSIFENYGHLETATNNDAELRAAFEGVTWLTEKLKSSNLNTKTLDISLVSDSQIILGWAQGTNQVRQESKREKVYDLQLKIMDLGAKCVWVKGHSGNEWNERCDRLANAGRLKILPNELKDKKKLAIGERKSGVMCVEYNGVSFVVDLIRKKVERFDASLHGNRDILLRLEDK